MRTDSCSGGIRIACCSYITLCIFIQVKPEESEDHGKVSGKRHYKKLMCALRGRCEEESLSGGWWFCHTLVFNAVDCMQGIPRGFWGVNLLKLYFFLDQFKIHSKVERKVLRFPTHPSLHMYPDSPGSHNPLEWCTCCN